MPWSTASQTFVLSIPLYFQKMVRSPPKFCSCGLYNFIFTLFKIKTKQYLKCLLVHFKIIKHPLFFNWRIIALQCCIGFCHTITPISHNYIYIYTHIYIHTHTHIYISSHLPPNLPPIPPPRSTQSTGLGTRCYTPASH